MRIIKMLGSAGAVVLIAMACVGAGTAAADSACLKDVGINGVCPEGAAWTGPVIGLAKKAVFKIDNTETKCKGKFLADYVANEGEHVGVIYLVLTLTFSECEGACENAIAEELPYMVLVKTLQKQAMWTKDGKPNPPAVLLENCMILNTQLDCLYETPDSMIFPYVLEKDSQEEPLAGALVFNPQLFWAGDNEQCTQEAQLESKFLIYEDIIGVEGPELFFASLP